MKKSKLKMIGILGLFWFITAVSFPGTICAAPADWPKTISIAAARVGTGNYNLSAGMGELITKYLGVKSVPEASSVGGKTLHLMNRKEVEFAVSFSDQAFDAARGIGNYKTDGKMNVRQMWMGTVAPFAMIARADSDIGTVAELRGRKVMGIYPGNMSFTKIMDLFLESEGMTRNDIKDISFTGWKEGSAAVKEKRVAAFIHPMPSEGMAGWLKQVSMEAKLRLFAVDEDKIDAIVKKYPYLMKCKLYAKYYGDMTLNKDLVTMSPVNSMFCRSDLPESLVYSVMKTVFDHLDELYPYHKDVKSWTDNPLYPAVVPYHPGVIKYWKEKGRWTPELDALQKKLLAEVGASK